MYAPFTPMVPEQGKRHLRIEKPGVYDYGVKPTTKTVVRSRGDFSHRKDPCPPRNWYTVDPRLLCPEGQSGIRQERRFLKIQELFLTGTSYSFEQAPAVLLAGRHHQRGP